MAECEYCHGNHYYRFRDETVPCGYCAGSSTFSGQYDDGYSPDDDGYSPDDDVNHPEHYNLGQEPFPFIESWGMSFAEGCVIKYVVRHKHKGGLKDLKKAAWYLNKLIESYDDET